GRLVGGQGREIGPEVGGGDDQCGRGVRGVAFWEAARIAEAGRIEERVVDLDARIDNRDLDASPRVLLATDRAALPQLVGADLWDAREHIQLIAQVGV